MLCKNTGTAPAEFQIDGHPGHPPKKYKVPPGETVDIPDGYCQPYKSETQRTQPPIISQLHPNMKPLGERAKGQLATAAPVGDDTQAAILAELRKLGSKVDNLENDNRALRRENSSLRQALPDHGAAADVKVAEGEGDESAEKPTRRKAS
jgi:hypothetical protein